MGDALLLFNISRPQRLTELSNVTQMASRTLAGNSQSIVQGRLLEKTLLKRLDVSGPRLFPLLFLLAIGPGGRILRIEEPSGVWPEHLADVALAIRREFANEANGLFVDEPMRGLSGHE